MDQELRYRNQGSPQDPHNDAAAPPGAPFGYPPQPYTPPMYGGFPQGYGDPGMGFNPNYMAGGDYPAGPPMGPGMGQPGMPGIGVDNNVMMQFGMQYGSRMLQKTHANVSRYLFTFRGLHYYFTVNNSYVKNKLKLLLFPLRHKYRRREVDAGHRFESLSVVASSYNYLTAVDDINAPDMYIPLMAVITYTLLVGFFTGIAGQNFSPEMLIATATSCALLTALEVLALRFVVYILAVPKAIYALDLLCYVSYKFFSASVILLLRQLLPRAVYYVAWLTLALFHGYFLMQTLKLHWQGSTSHAPNYFLYVLAALQVPIFFWLQHL
eukprot:GGOE01036881.1.p1 GENE.GGOE01036881.1~~GGOE01036881.1.p1  ORF type:complete len:351 (-),score=115.53 GGOE01036881.1:206-1177(-)